MMADDADQPHPDAVAAAYEWCGDVDPAHQVEALADIITRVCRLRERDAQRAAWERLREAVRLYLNYTPRTIMWERVMDALDAVSPSPDAGSRSRVVPPGEVALRKATGAQWGEPPMDGTDKPPPRFPATISPKARDDD